MKTYLYYDPEMQAWSNQDYTLEEICSFPGVTDETHICLPDGSRTLTVAQAREAYGTSDTFTKRYEYRVIEHTKYNMGKLDTKAFEAKLNAMARSGWRVIGVCAPDTMTTATPVYNDVMGVGCVGEKVSIAGLVAVLERQN